MLPARYVVDQPVICLPPDVSRPLDRSMSFWHDVRVYVDGCIVVTDPWYWLATVNEGWPIREEDI